MSSPPTLAAGQQAAQNPLREVAENIYQLRQPLPFTLNHVNCYLLRDSDGWTILDAGLNRPELRERWLAAWHELSIAPHTVRRIVLTHMHPDHFGLAGWLQEQTGADMLLWQGSCLVHDEFKATELIDLKRKHPQAKVLVHPESPEAVIHLADAVGSTTQIIRAAQTMDATEFIVATDKGIFHKMKAAAPGKTFIEAPTAGNSATCKSCAHCPWMAMNGLVNLAEVLETFKNEVQVDPETGRKAKRSIQRMLDFAAGQNLSQAAVRAQPGDAKGMGPA